MLYRTRFFSETHSAAKAERSNLTNILSELINSEVDVIPQQVRGYHRC